MAADVSDLLQEVGLPGTATTLSAPGYTVGDATINVEATTNWTTATGVSFAIDQTEVVEGKIRRIDGSYCEFVGVVTGADEISSVDLVYGSPQDYPAGTTTRVYVPVSSERENRIVEWGTNQHKQTGAHSDITTDSIVNAGNYTQSGGAFTIPNNSIDANELSTSAICLGYEPISTPAFTTTSSAPVLVTGLSVTVTIPAGGRRVKITVFTRSIIPAATFTGLSIWDGDVGTGTQLSRTYVKNTGSAGDSPATCIAVITPSAGSKTYNVGLEALGGGTAQLTSGPLEQSFILVEVI